VVVPDGVSSRRAFLLGGIGAAVVAALHPVAAVAETGGSMVLGVENAADAETSLWPTNLDTGGFAVELPAANVGHSAIRGRVADGTAIFGQATNGSAVQGWATDNAAGFALSAIGRLYFDGSSGTLIVPAGRRSATRVCQLPLMASTHILATVNSTRGIAVRNVSVRPSRNRFTVFLTAEAPVDITVAWFQFDSPFDGPAGTAANRSRPA
jgi:hypothetical protein